MADQHDHAGGDAEAGRGESQELQDRIQKTPASFRRRGFRFHQIKSLAVTYFHIDKVDTSIGAERFHFRVRKGIGWFPLAMAARQTGRNGGLVMSSPHL